MSFNVAIDGPAGAGKSTAARTAAELAGFIYVDTGAMYRAIGLYFLENDVDIHDEEACSEKLPDIQVTIIHQDDVQHILLNGEDVSDRIRTQEVGEAASVTSAYPEVRAKLLDLQRDLARAYDVIMDGRDIGTTILPDADLKIFLTASADVRAMRRVSELEKRGIEADFEAVRQEILDRDERDMNREISPLRQAEDAVVLDSSYLNIEETAEEVLRLIRERQQNGD